MVAKKRAKKTTKKRSAKNKSAMALQDNLSHPVQTVYHLLAMMGVIKSESDLKIRYEGYDYNVSIALPLIKYAIAFEGDNTKGLEEDGWHIEHVAYRDVEPFSRIFFSVDNARVAEMYARADPNVKTTSIPEEKLFIEFKRRRMPEPDRNYKFTRDDGSELTTPDFTWEDMKLAFFMDGSYWHSVKSDQDIIKEIKSSRKMQDTIVEKRKDKTRKDGAIRSELAARGWTVLSCTDDDIETSEGLREIVDMVERAMNTIASVNKVVADRRTDEKGTNSIIEFLGGDDGDESDYQGLEDGEKGEAPKNIDSPAGESLDAKNSTLENIDEDRVDNPEDLNVDGYDESKQSIIDFINSNADDTLDTVVDEDEEIHESLNYEDM